MSGPHDFHTPKSSYSKEDLLLSGKGGYFGPGNAQLPEPPMLMMDRITEISLDGGPFGKGHVVGELDIHPDLWFFKCHFPGDPVMPGCLGLDAMWEAVGYWLGWSGSPGKGRSLTGVFRPARGVIQARPLRPLIFIPSEPQTPSPQERRKHRLSSCAFSNNRASSSIMPDLICSSGSSYSRM